MAMVQTRSRKSKPLLQQSACRATSAPAFKKQGDETTARTGLANLAAHRPKDNLLDDDWRWTEAALSRYFGGPIRLYDAGEIDSPAEEPGQSFGTLAQADADDLWYPPERTPIFYADDLPRPCTRKEARFWTCVGAHTWFKVATYPPPEGLCDAK